MKFSLTLLVASLLIIISACTDKKSHDTEIAKTESPTTDTASTDISLLLREIDQINSKCRGLSGDSPEGMAACDKRDQLIKKAEIAGWCWGPKNALGYQKQWIKCSDDPDNVPKRQWFSHDLNHVGCIKSQSPADKIREIQDFGRIPKTNDLASGAVEIEIDIGNDKSQVWTFYRTQESCEASLPRSQKIQSRYE